MRVFPSASRAIVCHYRERDSFGEPSIESAKPIFANAASSELWKWPSAISKRPNSKNLLAPLLSPLNRACDLPVLDGSEIDEVLSALHLGFRLALVGWPVCDGVGDYQGAIDR
jgi:hypothetical protein